MNLTVSKIFSVSVIGAGLLATELLPAQIQGTPALTNSGSATAVVAPPQLPAKSPIEFFRELLSQPSAEQLEFLKDRPPAAQKLILDKVREYKALSPEQRELRLRVTELHYYLLPLMSVPATNRATRLALIAPPETRKLVEDRLQQWDKLSPESQRDLLQNEATLRTLTEIAATPPTQQKHLVSSLTEAQKAELETGIRKWQSLSSEQRNNTIRRFNQFFDLTPAEKQDTLATLSEVERHQLQRTLVAFDNLTPVQRSQCLRSFEKFASLTPEERLQFLKSAELWTRMSPSQRQVWKDLVYNLGHQPPVPPALGQPPTPYSSSPPLPTSAKVTGTN